MDHCFDLLRRGISPGASPEARRAASAICRLLHTALETPAGSPLAVLDELSKAESHPSQGAPHDDAEPVAATDGADAAGPAGAEGSAEEPTREHQTSSKGGAFPPEEALGAAEPPPSAHVRRPTVPRLPLHLDPESVAALVRASRSVPAEQLLDAAISRVQSILRDRGVPVPSPKAPALAFPILPLPASLLRGGSR